jgi:hypothetical protein
MVDPARALDGLRDIHWPVAADAAGPVVTMILIGCLLAGGLSAGLWPLLRRWRAVRRSALAALAASRSLDPPERLAAQAVLLRRLVRTIDGDAAGRLQGRDWLERLDRLFATRFFTEGAGSGFGEALYRPPSGEDPDRHIDALDASLARLFAGISR